MIGVSVRGTDLYYGRFTKSFTKQLRTNVLQQQAQQTIPSYVALRQPIELPKIEANHRPRRRDNINKVKLSLGTISERPSGKEKLLLDALKSENAKDRIKDYLVSSLPYLKSPLESNDSPEPVNVLKDTKLPRIIKSFIPREGRKKPLKLQENPDEEDRKSTWIDLRRQSDIKQVQRPPSQRRRVRHKLQKVSPRPSNSSINNTPTKLQRKPMNPSKESSLKESSRSKHSPRRGYDMLWQPAMSTSPASEAAKSVKSNASSTKSKKQTKNVKTNTISTKDVDEKLDVLLSRLKDYRQLHLKSLKQNMKNVKPGQIWESSGTISARDTKARFGKSSTLQQMSNSLPVDLMEYKDMSFMMLDRYLKSLEGVDESEKPKPQEKPKKKPIRIPTAEPDTDADFDQIDDRVVQESLRKLNREKRRKKKNRENIALSYVKRNGKETPVIEDPPWEINNTKIEESQNEELTDSEGHDLKINKHEVLPDIKPVMDIKPAVASEKEGNVRKLTITLPRVPPPTPTLSRMNSFQSALPPLKVLGNDSNNNKKKVAPVVRTTAKQLAAVKPRLYDKYKKMRHSRDDNLSKSNKTENKIAKGLTEQLVTAHGNYRRRMEEQRSPKDNVHKYSINVVHKHHPDVKLAPITIPQGRDASEDSSQSSNRSAEDNDTNLNVSQVVQYHNRNHPVKRRHRNSSYITSFVPELVSHRSMEQWDEKFLLKKSRMKYKHNENDGGDQGQSPKAQWNFSHQVVLSPLPKPVLIS